MSGTVPSELGKLTNLKALFLYGNQLSGEIPPELANLTELTHLFLARNLLRVCLPAILRKVLHNDLDRLDLPDCDAP